MYSTNYKNSFNDSSIIDYPPTVPYVISNFKIQSYCLLISRLRGSCLDAFYKETAPLHNNYHNK